MKRSGFADYDSTGAGVLRIGAGGAVCEHLLPGVLKDFRVRFPRIELHVLSGHAPLTVQRLLEEDLDVGMVTLPVSESRLRVYELGRDELVAIVAPSHRWSTAKRIRSSDLATEQLLVYERRSQTFHIIERLLLEAGVFPPVAMEMDHLGAVTGMVRAALGVAVVPAGRWRRRFPADA